MGQRPAAAWRIIAFSVVTMTMTVFGQTNGVSVFVDPVAGDLGLSRSEVSAAYSVATLLAAFFLPTFGRRMDLHGIRRVVLPVGVAFGAVIIGLAFADGLPWLAVGFFGIRLLGQGALSLAARTIVALRFRTRLGSAVGISGALAALGMSLGPFLLASLIGEIGWRPTWVVAGIVVWLVMAPLAIWFLRSGEDRAAPPPPNQGSSVEQAWTREQAIRTPMFWVVTLAIASVAMIGTGLAFHQISLLGEAGLSPSLAAANFIPQTVAAVSTIALVAGLSSRVPPGLLLAGSMTSLAAALALLMLLDQPWVPLLYALAAGGATGSVQALDGTLYPRFFGLSAIAAIRGTGFMVAVVGAAIGPLLVALLRDASGGYAILAPALIWIPILIAAAAVLTPRPRLPADRAGGRIIPRAD